MDMLNKYIYVCTIGIALLAGLIFSASCNREILEVPQTTEEEVADDDVIKAVYPVMNFANEDGTRTTYSDAASGNFAWETGDQIKIFYNINKGGTGNYQSVLATLTPVSGSENIATISGISASDIDTNYPCLAFFALRYDADPRITSSYFKFGCPYSGYSSSDFTVDISSNHSSYKCPLAMAAVYDSSSQEFHFAHRGVGLLRFLCNNVPTGTNYLTVSIGSANIIGNYGITGSWLYTTYNYSTGLFEVSTEEYALMDDPLKFKLFTDSSGLTSAEDGVILNMPVLTSAGDNVFYKDFTIKAYSSSNTLLAESTIETDNVYVDPGWGYRYTVNLVQPDNGPYTISFKSEVNTTITNSTQASAVIDQGLNRVTTTPFEYNNDGFRVYNSRLYIPNIPNAYYEVPALTINLSDFGQKSSVTKIELNGSYPYAYQMSKEYFKVNGVQPVESYSLGGATYSGYLPESWNGVMTFNVSETGDKIIIRCGVSNCYINSITVYY